jgi:hypothetical protein
MLGEGRRCCVFLPVSYTNADTLELVKKTFKTREKASQDQIECHECDQGLPSLCNLRQGSNNMIYVSYCFRTGLPHESDHLSLAAHLVPTDRESHVCPRFRDVYSAGPGIDGDANNSPTASFLIAQSQPSLLLLAVANPLGISTHLNPPKLSAFFQAPVAGLPARVEVIPCASTMRILLLKESVTYTAPEEGFTRQHHTAR